MNATEILATNAPVHIVGIGGAGMSAIAAVLVAMGHRVSGSDLKDSAVLDRLRALGVEVHVGHDGAQVGEAGALVISSAVSANNVEVRHAQARKIAVLSRADLLAGLTTQKKTVTIAGTHGKTTTTSMLALILLEAAREPSFIIGGEVNEIGTNASWRPGEWLVVEADESDGTFLRLERTIACVTNVEVDHLDHFGSPEALARAFDEYVAGATRASVICLDDPGAAALARHDSITYGFSDDADIRIVSYRGERSAIAFDVLRRGEPYGHFEIPVPGAHNARNAAGAIAIASLLEVPVSDQQRALARFGGVARRFEFRGERGGITFVDDYAHLPGEVEATLEAARAGNWGRVICVFQPHRYSRVEALAGDFADCFTAADELVLTSIYPAGELARPGVSSKLILDAVLESHPTTKAVYLPERADLAAYLKKALRPGDCCLTLGAGDLTTLPDELVAGEDW
jgi:UDP-N-acetylmuramate--alanine ligase